MGGGADHEEAMEDDDNIYEDKDMPAESEDEDGEDLYENMEQ